jgi:hypothetical protein
MTRAEREFDFGIWMAAIQARTRGAVDAVPQRWLRPIDRFAAALVPSLVHKRVWRIVELPGDVATESPLITCDNPVVLVRPRADADPDLRPGWDVHIGGGWLEPGVQMTLALSRRHALMLVQDPEDLTLTDDPSRFAESIRVRTARHALRHVYARDEDPRIVDLMRATRAPEVVFEVGGEVLPSTADPREIIRRVGRAGVTQIGVRYSA